MSGGKQSLLIDLLVCLTSLSVFNVFVSPAENITRVLSVDPLTAVYREMIGHLSIKLVLSCPRRAMIFFISNQKCNFTTTGRLTKRAFYIGRQSHL